MERPVINDTKPVTDDVVLECSGLNKAIALWETSVTLAPCSARIHLLTGFLAALYAILPLILGAIIDAKELLALSPIGYGTVLAAAEYTPDMSPLILGAGITAALLIFIFRRYRTLAKSL